MGVWEKSQYISSLNDDECWKWLGNKNGNGYGQFKKFGLVIRLHKFSYEFFKGEVPQGLEIDHLCRNRSCFNPEHLEAVTHKINIQRGVYNNRNWDNCHGAINNFQRTKTHCPQGHELSGDNLVKSAKWRTCKICKRNRGRKDYWERNNIYLKCPKCDGDIEKIKSKLYSNKVIEICLCGVKSP